MSDAKSKRSGMVQVVVARGRSIQVGDRLYLAGEACPLPLVDYEHLKDAGFIADPDEPEVVRTVAKLTSTDNPAALGFQQVIEG